MSSVRIFLAILTFSGLALIPPAAALINAGNEFTQIGTALVCEKNSPCIEK